ncbi:hypothetical protein EV586_11060 [Tumebacillus sp. BK434]|nr:hypothetical protein EV586_11060 [Tumebacillus sp. BK434]
MIGYRRRNLKMGAKRIAGITVASAGLYLTARFLPPEMWVSLMGLFMIWIGWILFKN